jgi:hypothetical protein
MVAPTGVNEGAPQEPAAAGRPGPATAELTQAEAPTEDQAGPAGDLMEMAPAEAVDPEAVDTVPAEVVPAEAELAGAGLPGPDAGQESRGREESRDVGPLAVVGIIIGVIALVGVAAGVLAMVTHGFKPKTVVSYRPAAVFGLRPGQCINSGPNSLSYTVVSCTSPHDAEVFARFSLPAAAWPGSSAVRQEAGDACASKLGGYLNPQLATIGLTQGYVYPNRDAWDADQRTVVCEVSSGNGQLTGSVRAKG